MRSDGRYAKEAQDCGKRRDYLLLVLPIVVQFPPFRYYWNTDRIVTGLLALIIVVPLITVSVSV